MGSWIRGFKHYRQQSMGKLYFVGYLFSLFKWTVKSTKIRAPMINDCFTEYTFSIRKIISIFFVYISEFRKVNTTFRSYLDRNFTETFPRFLHHVSRLRVAVENYMMFMADVDFTWTSNEKLRFFPNYFIHHSLIMLYMRMQEEFEDTKGVIRSRKSKKDRQHNGQKSNQWSIKHYMETKVWATRTPLKTRCELRCSERVSILCSTCGIRHVTLTNPF
jgi:hypothetical protein